MDIDFLFAEYGESLMLCLLTAAVAGRVLRRLPDTSRRQTRLALGAVLGLAALASMQLPVTIAPGIVFDCRAVPIVLAALFGGMPAAAAALLPPLGYRMWLGGDGLPAAFVSFALTVALGVLLHLRLHRRGRDVRLPDLALAGALLPFASFAAFLALPGEAVVAQAFAGVGVTILVVYPVGVLLLGLLLQDESRRVGLMRRLTAQRGLLQSVTGSVPAMLHVRRMVDGAPRFTYVSDGANDVLGLSPQAMQDDVRHFVDIVHPDDRARVRAALDAPPGEGTLPAVEYRIVRPDGKVRWLRGNVTIVEIDGAPAWAGVTIDVTEARASAERAHVLAQLVESTGEAVIQLDPQFGVVFMNPAAERLYGRTSAGTAGQSSAVFRPPERVDFMSERLAVMAATLRPATIETEALRADGRVFPVELRVTPLFDQAGAHYGWVSICYDLTEQKRHEQELHRQATTDPLTGAVNRRALEERARIEIARCARSGRPLGVIIADVDHFKSINDGHGHAAGDRVLQVLADALRLQLRAGDHLARYGGEEFVLLLPETDAEGAGRLAERLRQAVQAMAIDAGGEPIRPTASFGVAAWQPGEADLDGTLARADAALYEAKRAGRNAVRLADGTAPASGQRRSQRAGGAG